MKLNVGCGNNKIDGYINIDTEESCAPDLVHNLLKGPLPYEDGSVEEILFFHCIEHVQKGYHDLILQEFYRLLKGGGTLLISYPNFWECAQRWKQNTDGNRKFWEATLYGRQLYESDFHVCAMDPGELADLLMYIGFEGIVSTPEPSEPFNSITFARKGSNPAVRYEDVLRKDIRTTVINESPIFS